MLPLLLLALAVDGSGRCSLSGTVVDSVTGKGIARVEMALEPFERLEHHVAVSTSDAEGGFSIQDVDCGYYRLTGRRARYLEARRAVANLEAGSKPASVTYKLVPAGVIAGTVRNAEGEAVPGAHMILARRTAHRLEGLESTDADDQGNYRFGYLRPGVYSIAAETPGKGWNRVDHSATPSSAPESDILTFHPAGADPSMASAIAVAPGAQVTGIDVRMLRSRVYRVRGRVVGTNPRAPMQLVLHTEDDLPDFLPTTFTHADGGFEFHNVPPGSYLLNAGECTVPVAISNADVEGIEMLPGAGGGTLEGHLRVEGDDARMVGARVHLRGRGQFERVLHVQREPRFTMSAPAGRVRVEVFPQNAGDLYVKSIRSGSVDVAQEGLLVRADSASPLEIVLAPASQVGGIVTGDRDQPVAGATVVLVPGFGSAVTDQLGRFTIGGLGAGEYRAYAWEDVEEDAWHEPDFLKAYEPQKVEVAERERKAVGLKLSSK